MFLNVQLILFCALAIISRLSVLTLAAILDSVTPLLNTGGVLAMTDEVYWR